MINEHDGYLPCNKLINVPLLLLHMEIHEFYVFSNKEQFVFFGAGTLSTLLYYPLIYNIPLLTSI